MAYTLLRKYGRNFKLWARIRIEHQQTYIFTLFFCFSTRNWNRFFCCHTKHIILLCISSLPILIIQWMHTSVVHIGHEGTKQYTKYICIALIFFLQCSLLFHTNMNHQENILLFIFRNYLLLVFEKNVTEWTNWTLLNKAARHNF